MCAEQAKVEVENEKRLRTRQWGKGFIWRKEGHKQTLIGRNLTAFCGAAFVILAVILFVVPVHTSVDSTSASGSFASPSELDTPQEMISVAPRDLNQPLPSDGTDLDHRHPRGVSKYAGPQVIIRPGAGKIPPGTLVRAILTTGASDGPVRAEVREAALLNGETLIPAGTVLVGQGQSGENRLYISFTQMVDKDGASLAIQAQACDPIDQIAGVKGSKVGRELSKLSMGIGLNFVGGMSSGLQESAAVPQGYGMVVTRPSLKNALLNGTSSAALSQAHDLMTEYREKKQVVEVPARTEVYVLF